MEKNALYTALGKRDLHNTDKIKINGEMLDLRFLDDDLLAEIKRQSAPLKHLKYVRFPPGTTCTEKGKQISWPYSPQSLVSIPGFGDISVHFIYETDSRIKKQLVKNHKLAWRFELDPEQAYLKASADFVKCPWFTDAEAAAVTQRLIEFLCTQRGFAAHRNFGKLREQVRSYLDPRHATILAPAIFMLDIHRHMSISRIGFASTVNAWRERMIASLKQT